MEMLEFHQCSDNVNDYLFIQLRKKDCSWPNLLLLLFQQFINTFNKDFIYTTTVSPCQYYQTMRIDNTITKNTFEISIFLDFY